MVKLRPPPTSPPRPYGRRPAVWLTPLDRLSVVAKACQDFATILALVSSALLVVVNHATSRYLATFGQPGLSSLGDVASFSVAVLPVTLFVVFMIVGFAALPVITRAMAEAAGEHAFTPAYNWPARGLPGWRRSAHRCFLLHIPILLVSLTLILCFFDPKANPSALIWALPLIAIPIAVFGLINVKTARLKLRRGGNPYATTVLVVVMSGFFGTAWLATSALIVLRALSPYLAEVSATKGAWVATAVVLALALVHLAITAANRRGSIVLAVGLGLALLAFAGPLSVLGFSLRLANLGGGAPVAYRPSDAPKDAAPRTACLVLAAGDTRIVWLPPPPPTGQVAAPCAWAEFRTLIRHGAMAVAANRLGAATGVRAFKREDLYDKP